MVTTTVAPASRPKPGRVFSKPRIGTGGSVDLQNPAVAILGNGGSLSKIYQGYEERRQQLDLSAFIWDALKSGQHAAGEAGTGVGKSFAYLAPLILTGEPSLVAVPTNALLTQLMTKDLPALSQPGVMPRRFTYAELKGRANYVCLYKSETYAEAPEFESREDGKAWPAISDFLSQTVDGDLGKVTVTLPMAIRQEITATSEECLGERCPAFDRCYAEKAKARAADADIIVTNLTMLMLDLELRATTGGMAAIVPDRRYIVIDEGHQLRERAASAATQETRLGGFERMAQQIVKLAEAADRKAQTEDGVSTSDYADRWAIIVDPVRQALGDLFERFADRLADGKESAQRLGNELDVSQDALVMLHALVSKMEQETPSQLDDAGRESWDKLQKRLGKYLGNLCLSLFPSPIQPMANQNTVRYASVDDRGRVTLAHAPIDVAPWLRERLWTASLVRPVVKTDGTVDRSVCVPVTVIVVSATIVDDSGSLGYFRETVGLGACREIVVGSPFNYRDNGVLYVPADNAFDSAEARKTKAGWAEYLDRLTDEYERLIRISGGRAFCLFTANTTLDYVYNRLRERGMPYPMLRQGDFPLPELIHRFKTAGNAVVFGVKSLWEGVDVAGSALSLVIISGTPFTPPSDPTYAARCQMADRRYGERASFQKISIPEATIALKQAFGRGIRTATDQAAVCILDSRLRYKRYGAGILAALPPSPLVGSTEDVAAFFERIS